MVSTSALPGTTRRTVLKAAGATAAVALAGPLATVRPVGAREDPGLAPFLHGVASGDPLADRVIIWTRIDPEGGTATVPVRWIVFSDLADPEGSVLASGTEDATPERDWTVKIDVTGLAPYTTYFYEFAAADGRRSLIGRTRTAPDTAVDALRFGVVGCSNYPEGWFNAYAALALRQDLDAILHTGDYQYEYADANTERPVGNFETVTLDQYRARTKAYRLDPDLRRLHQLFPMIATWDDHESANNSFYGGAGNHTPGAEGDWFDRKDAAGQAYDEYLPFRKPDQSAGPFGGARTSDDGLRIYRVVPYGPLARIIVLDTRIEGRDPEAPTPAIGPDPEDPERTILGPTQREWFFDQLSGAKAEGVQWKVVLQQVMVQQWNAVGITDLGVQGQLPGNIRVVGDGLSVNGDAWDGYTAERARFLDHLADNDIDDVVVLTGDIHMAFAADLAKDPYNPVAAAGGYDPLTGAGSLAVEFVNQSVTSSGLGAIAGPEVADAVAAGSRTVNPHQKHTEFTSHGFFVLTLTGEAAQADWYNVATIAERDTSHAHDAAWKTLQGTNHLVPATEASRGAEAPAPPASLPAAEPADPAAGPGTGVAPAAGAPNQRELPRTGTRWPADAPLVGGTAALAAALAIRSRRATEG